MKSLEERLDNPTQKDLSYFAELAEDGVKSEYGRLLNETLRRAIQNELSNPDYKVSAEERIGYLRGLHQVQALSEGHIQVGELLRQQKKKMKAQEGSEPDLHNPSSADDESNTAGMI